MADGKKIKSDNWRELPIEDWNANTFKAYLVDKTTEKFGVTYEPIGRGAKAQRWSRESGMIKQAYEKYGRAELKAFIDLCMSDYITKPKYPYMTFTFAWSYMRENMAKAELQVAKGRRKQEAAEVAESAEIDEGFF